MNNFQTTETGEGLLKDFYDGKKEDESAVATALKSRRRKLTEKIAVPTKLEIEGGDDESE